MHTIVELNELNIFCEFFTISSQINYCVMLVSYGITTVMSPPRQHTSFVFVLYLHLYNNYTMMGQRRRR